MCTYTIIYNIRISSLQLNYTVLFTVLIQYARSEPQKVYSNYVLSALPQDNETAGNYWM